MKEINLRYLTIYKGIQFNLSFEEAGYFDCRPRIHIDLYLICFIFKLPFKSKWTDECNPPRWGFAVHNNAIWFYYGGKGNYKGNNTKAFYLPFLTKEWVRTSIMLKDGSWEHERPRNIKNFYEDTWKNKQYVMEFDFLDRHDNTVIPTKAYVEEREWRPKWLTWTSLFSSTRRDLDLHFSKEVGNRKGSWKGGILGTGYKMYQRETPEQAVVRLINDVGFLKRYR